MIRYVFKQISLILTKKKLKNYIKIKNYKFQNKL